MTLPREVEEHIDNLEYSQAINFLKGSVNSTKENSEEWIVLLNLCFRFEKESFFDIQNQYLNLLIQKELFEEFLNYYTSKVEDSKLLLIDQRVFLLKSYWHVGQIKHFKSEAQLTSVYLLDNKLYNKYEHFLILNTTTRI